MSKKVKVTEPLRVSSTVWKTLLEIEALRTRERKIIRNLWRDLKEDKTQTIHQLVFEQAMSSSSAFPSVSKKELEDWIIENISTVIITLIEQGDIIVLEQEPNRTVKWLKNQLTKITERKEEKKAE
ncbi:hypothetical protein [Candidatus Hodarchaeum mangrovi]